MPAPTSFFLYKLGKEIKSTYIQEVMIELKSLKLGNAIQSTTLHLRSRGVKKKKKIVLISYKSGRHVRLVCIGATVSMATVNVYIEIY